MESSKNMTSRPHGDYPGYSYSRLEGGGQGAQDPLHDDHVRPFTKDAYHSLGRPRKARRSTIIIMLLTVLLVVCALGSYSRSYATATPPRRWIPPAEIDLGYQRVQGFVNESTGLNRWNGIRYGVAERFGLPSEPGYNGTTQDAKEYGPLCYQSNVGQLPAASGNVSVADRRATANASEDCLVLNVYAPYGSHPDSKLPVLVYIHGGGYAYGSIANGATDYSEFVNLGNGSFVVVTIQYRLGAFGFLAGPEYIQSGGVPNAGLLDQELALQWVQSHIAKFGGDRTHVTLWGESAGAGSVMNHIIAHGGDTSAALGLTEQTGPLFQNAIVSSVFLPSQFGCADEQLGRYYDELAGYAGCKEGGSYDCLKNLDGAALANASWLATTKQPFGLWTQVPCTDGSFLTDRASVLLAKGYKQLNGNTLTALNNADEGHKFTDSTIANDTTSDAMSLASQFDRLLQGLFPNLDAPQREAVAQQYPSRASPAKGNSFDRVRQVIADSTFVCPTYWTAQSFNENAHKGYYAYGTAYHATDLAYYQGNITDGSRSISSIQSFTGALLGSAISYDPNNNPLGSINPHWPTFDTDGEIKFNTTDGTLTGPANPVETDANLGGVQWPRCDFWRGSISQSTPGRR